MPQCNYPEIGLERLSWLHHHGPLTTEQTFGNHRPVTGTASRFMQSASMLYNYRPVSVHGEKKKKVSVSIVNYTPVYGSESVTSMPRLLKCHGVLKSKSAKAKVDTLPYWLKHLKPNLSAAWKCSEEIPDSSRSTGAPGLTTTTTTTTCSPAHIQHTYSQSTFG